MGDESKGDAALALARAAVSGPTAAGFTKERSFECLIELSNLRDPLIGRVKVGEQTLEPSPRHVARRKGNGYGELSRHSAATSLTIRAAHWSDAVGGLQVGIVRDLESVLCFAQGSQPVITHATLTGKRYRFKLVDFQRLGSGIQIEGRVKDGSVYEFSNEVLQALERQAQKKRDRLWQAIAWLNEPLIASTATRESRFLMRWLAFEIALFLDRDNLPSRILDSTQVPQLAEAIRKGGESQKLSPVSIEVLVRRMSELNRPDIMTVMKRFCTGASIRVEDGDLTRIRAARNSIVHRPWEDAGDLRGLEILLDDLAFQSITARLGIDLAKYGSAAP